MWILGRAWMALRRTFRPFPRIHVEVVQPGDLALYATPSQRAPESRLAFPGGPAFDLPARLVSSLCTAEQLDSAAFRYWLGEIGEVWRFHRKQWEFGYLMQALHERGCLASGKRGLGFAVGQEALPSYFAAQGCTIVATDLGATDRRAAGWAESGEWSSTVDVLNRRGLCDPMVFKERVTFQSVDMNAIPTELKGFDFTWSSCSFEHCGCIELGTQFVLRQMDCLKPGGVAVHTTEFNLTSNTSTVSKGRTVLFRRADIEDMVRRLRAAGHDVEPLDLTIGTHPLDWFVDQRPYTPDKHLRKRQGPYAATSIGLIIRRALG
ncbi:MAG: class I SAM-dependent methyltransferase [Gemmatimonadota bacterium]|nr:class I SAM-dependent methyltransferase [Gemmatimonadota bacterium]